MGYDEESHGFDDYHIYSFIRANFYGKQLINKKYDKVSYIFKKIPKYTNEYPPRNYYPRIITSDTIIINEKYCYKNYNNFDNIWWDEYIDLKVYLKKCIELEKYNKYYDNETILQMKKDEKYLSSNSFNEEMNKYLKKKKIILNILLLIKFILKTVMIFYLINSFGQIVIFNTNKTNFTKNIRFGDHQLAYHFFTVLPKDIYTKDSDIYSVNGEFKLENMKYREQYNDLYYTKGMCDIDINYEKLSCGTKCENILKNFQNNNSMKVCYYDVEYNIFTNILIYTLPLLFVELYFMFLYKNYFRFKYSNNLIKDKNSEIYKIHSRYLKKEFLKDIFEDMKFNERYFKIGSKILMFLIVLFINFVWCDIFNYTFNNFEDNDFIYNNYMLLGQGFRGEYITYGNLKMGYIGRYFLIWITGSINQHWWTFIFLFLPYFASKTLFSFANLFKVFEVGFLQPRLIPIAFDITNPIIFFKPLFWYYFDLFIFPIIVEIFIFNDWNFCKKEIKDKINEIELGISKKEIKDGIAETKDKINEIELGISIEENKV